MTLPEAYQSQVQHIQPSPKFQQQGANGVQAMPFPGYTVITPPWCEDPKNDTIYQALERFQQQVIAQLEPGLLIPVPPDSFHMTLADLIWDSAYLHAAENPNFEQELRDRIQVSLQKCQPLVQRETPIYWQVIGLFLRTRALGVCLVPREEDSYDRVIQLRRAIYQNPDLMALGIEQQYNFTAHVTLGYFGEAAATTDRSHLSKALDPLSEYWLGVDPPQELWVHSAELRKFDDMTRYYRESDWAALPLSQNAATP
ncbi:MAG: DUF1868 domain-containing protein [Oculatellaceae cyanobacterium Prado106]|jgi:hypothetical protein|nr:DUF1868 domain-containing protein [Oculatellaceae cyanobacterium Prado106]